jgi:hypothetical protein
MSVEVLPLEEYELVYDFWKSLKYPREIHHLGEPQKAPVWKKRHQIGTSQVGPRGFKWSGRDAAWEMKIDIYRKVLGSLEKIADAVQSQNVGDLVGVCNHCGGSPGKDRSAELGWTQHRAFEMNMAVNESRAYKHVGGIDDLPGLVISPPEDDTVVNSQGDPFDPPGDHVHKLAVAQTEICRSFPLSSIDNADQSLSVPRHQSPHGTSTSKSSVWLLSKFLFKLKSLHLVFAELIRVQALQELGPLFLVFLIKEWSSSFIGLLGF